MLKDVLGIFPHETYRESMQAQPLKRLEMSERQAHVMELYHKGMTHRQISEQLKRERPKDKAWAVSHVTVGTDIQQVTAYYQQQAVDYYADWLAQELSRTVHGIKQASDAYEFSKKITKGGKRKNGIQREIPDARFSREQREWQDRLLKLLGVVREASKPVITQPADDKSDDQPEPQPDPAAELAPYLASIEQWRRSTSSQSATDLSSESAE